MQCLQIKKILAKKRFSFYQEIKVYPTREIGFAKRENFSQKYIKILPTEKNIAKKKYRVFQKRKV